jgi:mono/diheme cytochrome c family protein
MFAMWKSESVSSQRLAVSRQRLRRTDLRKGKAATRSSRTALSRILFLMLTANCLLLTAACRRDMQDQPKTIAYRESKFYKDGTASRPLVQGTVPRGFLRQDREFYFGKKATASAQPSPALTQTAGPQASTTNPATLYPDDVETFPIPITRIDIDRGQERYNIYCSVCHGLTGNGDGMIARRGFNRPAPASYHQDRLRQAPVGHFFDVMTNGWGAMPAYASQIPVEDRWRIIAYIRALQLSQMPKQGGSDGARESMRGSSPTVREGSPPK